MPWWGIWPEVDGGEPLWFSEKRSDTRMLCAGHTVQNCSLENLEVRGDIASCIESPTTYRTSHMGWGAVAWTCAIINALQFQLPEGFSCVIHGIRGDWKIPHASSQMRASHSGSFLCSGVAVLCFVSTGTQVYWTVVLKGSQRNLCKTTWKGSTQDFRVIVYGKIVPW